LEEYIRSDDIIERPQNALIMPQFE
jgi:hypothetical protein